MASPAVEQPDPFQLCGTTIEGKYRIASVVGDGGFGVVYRGVHKGFGELIAVKCLKLSGTLDDEQREKLLEQLRDEGRLLHRLSRVTSGIVQALDVGAFTTAAGIWVPYLVLEWLEGQTLAEFLRGRLDRGEGGLPLAEALRMLEPAARALSTAHKQKVAHRDVKPANLFVTEVGGAQTLKVLDFGIAKVLTSTGSFTEALAATKLGPTAFTPRYGAPEQFNKQRGASGPWTDVFALALILVELVSGKKALEGDDPTQLYIAAADPAMRPTLRARGVAALEPVERVLEKALSVEPKHRYADAGEFWDALVVAAADSAPSRASGVVEAGATDAAAPAAADRTKASARPGAGAQLALDPTMPVESVAQPSSPQNGGAAAARRAIKEDRGDPMAETPLPGRAHSYPSIPSERPAAGEGPAAPLSPAPAPKRGSLVWPFLGGAIVFGCAYFAYTWLHSPDAPAPSTSARPSAAPSGAKPRPTAGPAPSVSTSATASPPTPPEDMIYVAPATFHMGEAAEAREVTVSRGFFLDRDEVPVRSYLDCVRKRICASANRVSLGPLIAPEDEPGDGGAAPSDPPQAGGPLQPNEFIDTWTRACNESKKALEHPINCVDYESATSYCQFRGRRLPTEAEWELAARGASARPFAWGDQTPDCARSCIDKNATCRPPGENVSTCPVHQHGADRTPEGAFDLGGNVTEWVADGFSPKLAGGTDPAGKPGAPMRVVRGGNFVDGADRARATWRLGLPPNTALATVGFRCAVDATPPASDAGAR